MKKDKRFLKELEDNLVGISKKNKNEIISKYEKIISDEKANNKKITVILKEIGNPKDVAQKEISLLGKPSLFENIKLKISNISNNIKNKSKRIKKKSSNKKTKTKKNIFSLNTKVNNSIKEEKKKLKREKKELKKQLKREKKELKKEIKNSLPKEKKTLKDIFKPFITFITKDISINKNKEKKSKEHKFRLFSKKKKEESNIVESLKDTTKESVEDVKETATIVKEEIEEEFNEEISEAVEVVTEKKIFESKKDRRKRIILKTLGILLTVILLFIWLWVAVVFIASMFAYLDGVKFIGLNIALFGLTLLILWLVIIINRAIFKKKNYLALNLSIIIISIILIALGIVLMVKQVSGIETVKDVSDKYTMSTKFKTYNLPTDTNNRFNISFNSNYKTQYTVNYDKNLKDKVKVEVKYYECYYDYYIKETTNGVYISLKLDDRDRLSVYIDDLKEGKIYDNDELSRYTVKITVHPDDAGRLIIMN